MRRRYLHHVHPHRTAFVYHFSFFFFYALFIFFLFHSISFGRRVCRWHWYCVNDDQKMSARETGSLYLRSNGTSTKFMCRSVSFILLSKNANESVGIRRNPMPKREKWIEENGSESKPRTEWFIVYVLHGPIYNCRVPRSRVKMNQTKELSRQQCRGGNEMLKHWIIVTVSTRQAMCSGSSSSSNSRVAWHCVNLWVYV